MLTLQPINSCVSHIVFSSNVQLSPPGILIVFFFIHKYSGTGMFTNYLQMGEPGLADDYTMLHRPQHRQKADEVVHHFEGCV